MTHTIDSILMTMPVDDGTLRPGQRAFTHVWCLAPVIASKISGTDVDPFYDDSRIGAFWTRVGELLEEQER